MTAKIMVKSNVSCEAIQDMGEDIEAQHAVISMDGGEDDQNDGHNEYIAA